MTCVGTPLYMSPHMLDDKPCGVRSDIYSVGILLFEVLFEGKFPFFANTI